MHANDCCRYWEKSCGTSSMLLTKRILPTRMPSPPLPSGNDKKKHDKDKSFRVANKQYTQQFHFLRTWMNSSAKPSIRRLFLCILFLIPATHSATECLPWNSFCIEIFIWLPLVLLQGWYNYQKIFMRSRRICQHVFISYVLVMSVCVSMAEWICNTHKYFITSIWYLSLSNAHGILLHTHTHTRCELFEHQYNDKKRVALV